MTKNHTLEIIVALVILIGGLLSIFGYQSIPDFFNKIGKDNSLPFEIQMSPIYFNEGNYNYQYDKIPISLELVKKMGRNITELELPKNSFKSSRKDQGLNKPTSQVNWKNSYAENLIYISKGGYSYSSNLKAEGEMNLCQNCFIGDQYPYEFTFTIYWKENEGELQYTTITKEISIK